MALINEFSFSRGRLEVMVNQLKKSMENKWDDVNFSVTYDHRLRLTDDGFLITEGFMVIGKKEYDQLVNNIGTEDVKRLTDEIEKRIHTHRGYLYQQQLEQQIHELNSLPWVIDKGFIDGDEYATLEELAEHYQADKALYIGLNSISWIKVLFRGKSVLYQGYNGSKIVYEEAFPVDEQGNVQKRLKAVCEDFLETESTKYNYDGVKEK